MHDHPFESLREALLRTGVAPRHARRAVLELATHYHQLVAEGLARGDSEDAARIAARGVSTEAPSTITIKQWRSKADRY